MKKHTIITAAAAAALTIVFSSAQASAQSREVVTTSGPNRALLHSGLFAFGAPYVASVIVASTSDRSSDKNLYVPVVGPWMDLADRGDCGQAGATSCDTETGYKVLLIGNGILQGIGALEILGAFVMPETRTVTAATEPRLRLAPLYMGRGSYGVSAFASF